MLLPALILASFQATASAPVSSLLAAVPDEAHVLVHCRDAAGLHARAERNDWCRLLSSSHGEPLLDTLASEFQIGSHKDVGALLAMASELQGEFVFFDTGTVAGFLAESPEDPTVLAGLIEDWMPEGDPAARKSQDIAGGSVEIFAWPDPTGSSSGREGRFAAVVQNPRSLAIYAGPTAKAVNMAVLDGLGYLEGDVHAPLVKSYLANGGGKAAGGIELFVDFTPFASEAVSALARASEGAIPDPTALLGLEAGTWMHMTTDVFPGTRVDCNAKLRLPADSGAARLADTFQPLPSTLASDLPTGVWGLWALNWNLGEFYQRARKEFEAAERAEEFEMLDAGLSAVKGASGVDPIVDILNQMSGEILLYAIDPPAEGVVSAHPVDDDLRFLHMIGVQLGLLDGSAFLEAFESFFSIGGLESYLDFQEIAGAEVYLSKETGEFDGGLAFLPRAFTAAPARRVLDKALAALSHADGASLTDGSQMQATIGESLGACFLACVEMSPLRRYALPKESADLRLPPLEEGSPARDPFDSQLLMTAKRTRDGFTLQLTAR